MTFLPGKSLRVQFALYTVAATGSLIILVLLLNAVFSYRLFLADFEQDLQKQMEAASSSLETMITQTDYVGLLEQVNTLMITRGVIGVRIRDANRNLLMLKGEENGYTLQHRITHSGEEIGSIAVIFSNEPVIKHVRIIFLMGVVIAMVAAPLASVLMWFVTSYQLKDILAIADHAHHIGNIHSGDTTVPGMQRQDEIGQLARALAERNATILKSQKLEQLLYYAINQSHDSVVITDEDARIEYVNPAFTRITGYSFKEAVGLNPRILQSGRHTAKFYQILWETLSRGETWKGLIVNKRKNGEEYQEEATITPVMDEQGNTHHYVAMKRDVTAEVVLERKLDRAEKMHAIGMMAGGVAHDLNNILSGIIGYPELLLMDLPADSELRQPLQEIHDSGTRAAAVVADLLTVARGAAATRDIHDINVLSEQYMVSPECNELRRIHPAITFEQQLAAEQSAVSCSSIHIIKSLMNLVTNAAEAVSEAGVVLISTSNQYVDDEMAWSKDVKEGMYAVISVRDSGEGIANKDLKHIFEPFYTRKTMGRSGTGLGLAVVWNTVQDHGGFIEVESDVTGTCFQLFFPLSGEAVVVHQKREGLENSAGRDISILVVDDEPQLRDIACKMLHAVGYMVDAVPSGEQAIEYVQETRVDLLILDMLMDPGMNGYQTYAEILKLYPDQKAIIASGFSKSYDVKAAMKLGADAFLKKPYSMAELSRAVAGAVNS